MRIDPFHFASLIAPVAPEQFFAQHWEATPLLLGGRGARGYKGLPSLADVDLLLAQLTSPGFPWISFVRSGVELGVQAYSTSRGGAFPGLDARAVMAAFEEGTTIVLNGLHLRSESVQRLCAALEEVFGHLAGANLYLTPAGSQGFGPHYDGNDVFVLQLAGRKHWRIYAPERSFPLSGATVPRPAGAPLHDVVFEPGDFLYLPRGHVHEAFTTDDHSLHLTVGLQVFTWLDLIRELAASEGSLRRALPRGLLLPNAAAESASAGAGVFHALQQLARDGAGVPRAIDALRSAFTHRRRPPPRGQLAAFEEAQAITATTPMRKAVRRKAHLTREGGQTCLSFAGARIVIAAAARRAVEHMLVTPRFCAEDLPGALGKASKLDLVRALARSGFLAPAARKGRAEAP